MPRSASTAIFNLARLLLERAGTPFTSGWIDDITPPVHSTVLVKVHEWHPVLARRADLVLTSHRDLRAVARSLAAVGWLWSGTMALDHIATLVSVHAHWSAVARLDFRYETLVENWARATADIALALGIDPTAFDGDTVARHVIDMRPEIPSDREYDPVTLMHKNHRQKHRRGLPGLPIEDEIQRRFLGWQTAHGYS